MGREVVAVGGQLNGFLLSLVVGVVLGVFYDFFRIIRLCITKGKIAVFIQDILFWVVGAFFSYTFVFVINNGNYRIYFAFGELIGFVVYYFTFGEVVIKVSKFVVDTVRKVFAFILKIILFPFKKLYVIFAPKMMKLFKSTKNKVKISKNKYNLFLKRQPHLMYNEEADTEFK